ncbi:MAG: nucleotide sugar dehydrogenase, partial [Rhodothermales bacterium]
MSSQTISVIGAGKMGLPLVAQFAKNGATVIAVDINSEVVALINAGGCPIDEPGVDVLIKEGVDAGRISATTSAEDAVAKSDSVIIIVPAMLTEDVHADLAILEAVTRQVAAVLKPGTLVSYETTVPVGTTRNAFKPILDEAGVDYHLAFSPERVKSNHVLERLESTPKVIGATDSASRERAAEFYATYLGAPIINAGSVEAAEFVKLAGMLYRDVNIAFANELAGYAEKAGIDLPSLRGAINANDEANLLLPGIGVGGHCA